MSGKIPSDFIDALLARTDIVELIDSRVPLRKAGREFQACCPFHQEKTPSFTVSPTKQFYHCFGCGAHGTAIGFLMEYDRMDFREAVEDLASRCGMQIPAGSGPGAGAARRDDGADLAAVLERAEQFYRRQLRDHPRGGEAIAYLKDRGISGEVARDFGLGYAPDTWDALRSTLCGEGIDERALVRAGLVIARDDGKRYDRFRHRVMFPIHDHRGRIVGFGGRTLGDDQAKYLNTPETALFHKGSELYGLFRARDALRREQRALVVEGYMDVVALAQFGLDNAVGTLGTATTTTHLDRLFRHSNEIVFCFDGDRAGKQAAWRALETALPALRDGRQLSFLFLPEGEDPDSCVRGEGADAFRARVAAARPLPEFLLDNLCARVDLGRLDGQARLIDEARPLIGRLPAGALRELLTQELARLTRSDAQTVRRLLAEGRSDSRGAEPGRRPLTGVRPQRRTPRSRVAQAIELVLHAPGLAAEAGDAAEIAASQLPGAALLAELVELAGSRPELNTAAIVERYRGTEHGVHLEKLVAQDHYAEVADADRAAEFRDLLDRIRGERRGRELSALYRRASPAQLTEEEKQRLLEGLRART
jgi:DNA primase